MNEPTFKLSDIVPGTLLEVVAREPGDDQAIVAKRGDVYVQLTSNVFYVISVCSKVDDVFDERVYDLLILSPADGVANMTLYDSSDELYIQYSLRFRALCR